MNTQISSQIDAGLLALSLEDNFLITFQDIPMPLLGDFLETLDSENFGSIGPYSFFCKHCGQNWNFEKKIHRQIFRRFHNYTRCVFVWTKPEKDKDNKNVPYHLVRQNKHVPPHLEDFIKTLVMKIRQNEPITLAMQSESAI